MSKKLYDKNLVNLKSGKHCAFMLPVAAGTLTSLLCSKAKVVEKFLNKSMILGSISIWVLTSFFVLGNISESRAETWNCGPKDAQGNYGSNVKCTLENGVFTVSGNGRMGDFHSIVDNGLSRIMHNRI